MNKKVELKLKRVKLIQSGQEEKAHNVLKEYWALCSIKPKKQPIIKVIEKDIIEENIVSPIVKDICKFNSIKDLVNIKGIGKETVEDIEMIYHSFDNLMKALKSNKRLPLRNDVEKKLRKELI